MSEGADLSQPVLPGEGGSDYERYLRTDALLALQKGPDEWAHRDELLFQTVHQSSELWLKLAGAEVKEATALVAGADLPAAVRLLRRANHCLRIVTGALEMLEHLSPWEYQEVPQACSGTAAASTRPEVPGPIAADPRARGGPTRRPWSRRGCRCGPSTRDGREHEDHYQLAELLIELDERVVVWRVRHFVVVERIIGGSVVGTQGTPVEVLGRLIHKRYFPELWELRNDLTALSKSTG